MQEKTRKKKKKRKIEDKRSETKKRGRKKEKQDRKRVLSGNKSEYKNQIMNTKFYFLFLHTCVEGTKVCK